MTSTTMTIRVPLDVRDKLARLAEGTDRSRSYLAAAAVSAYVDRELAIIEGIQQGLADVADGRTTPHADVTAEAQKIIADARARKAARP
ncbi:CopG family ribbon-helix-helix protein [Blastomonas sp.]|uniref:CopG family ribbon-helix-helix protein n=1 Tax=Blastomonas sp. TaxID=1909299 RepID=UPI0035932436